MRASEFVASMRKLLEEHGDLPVFAPDSSDCSCSAGDAGPADPPEYVPALGYTPEHFYVSW